MPTATTAHLGIGSNLGDRQKNIALALSLLELTPGVAVAAVSRTIETPAVGGPPDSPPYLNAAATIHTTLQPQALLNALLSIEKQLGRLRRIKWEPRVIDLDILLFGDSTISEPGLTIPHPLMHQRLFVLAPLAEIAADALHPVFRRTVAELLAACQVAAAT